MKIVSRYDSSKILFDCETLQGAILRGADLRGADLQSANLQSADLRGADLNWQSHDLIAEILMQAAGEDVEKRK